MKKSTTPILGFALALPLLMAGCTGADAQPIPPDRASQVPLIIEEVLRFELQQFTLKESGAVCVAVREGERTTDPSPAIMRRLSNKWAQPQSDCKAKNTLTAGPIEWLKDDDVRVKGGYLRANEGETRLAYRVVRENGNWVCVGPIVSWDPL
jgi:hypothetical protein